MREREFGSATILTSRGEVGHSGISGSLMALLFDDGERGKTYVDKDGLGVVNDDGIGGHVHRILLVSLSSEADQGVSVLELFRW